MRYFLIFTGMLIMAVDVTVAAAIAFMFYLFWNIFSANIIIPMYYQSNRLAY